MLRIEFSPPHHSGPCECCGGRTTALTRFVYDEGGAYAVYYARFSASHDERVVLATVSIGEWGETGTPEQRCAFALRIWPGEENHNVSLLDAADSPWKGAKVIGRTLDRAEALAHSRLEEVFHITDHMISEDAPLREYLESGENGAA